jgi:hypothetical protein
VNNLSAEAKLQIWREAMAQLRHLNDDVWRSIALFLSLNVVNLGATGILFRTAHGKLTSVLLAIFISVGFALTLAAHYLLRRHRVYYLQMLAKKSLLELELGLYEAKLCGSEIDIAFPWRLGPQVVAEIKADSEKWIQKSIRSVGTIAGIYFLAYEVLLVLYALLALMLLYIR